MECLAGDAVQVYFWLADASPLEAEALAGGWLAGPCFGRLPGF